MRAATPRKVHDDGQQEMFKRQVKLCQENGKPLVLHLRHHDKDAPGDGQRVFDHRGSKLDDSAAHNSKKGKADTNCTCIKRGALNLKRRAA